jgi:hypothetical protein
MHWGITSISEGVGTNQQIQGKPDAKRQHNHPSYQFGWIVLVCYERKVLLAGWLLVCCERKVLLAGG